MPWTTTLEPPRPISGIQRYVWRRLICYRVFLDTFDKVPLTKATLIYLSYHLNLYITILEILLSLLLLNRMPIFPKIQKQTVNQYSLVKAAAER